MDIIVKIKEQVSGNDEPQTLWDEMGESMSLTWKQRMMGFGMFMAMSLVCYGLTAFFAPLVVILPKKFAFFFTCANLFGLGATTFLIGPSRQLRAIGDHNRMFASLVYFSSMGLTLVAALKWRNSALVFVFCALQIASIIWYSLSFIPYARQVASMFLGPILKGCLSISQHLVIGCGRCCGILFSR
eukprot:TRINITY_DN1537_c7_g1_i1.p1 TRINITY_DN1537_c7_g1~~TRINITY_DN1537_c7_g1_i1.p1  ORF type:complete len:201 (+),score=28.29 TRINITY_DN1537_c7_g1_i1:46-603(+)